MKSTTLFAGAAALFASAASAQNGNAAVRNQCDFPVYVQSYPYDGSAPGPLTTLEAKGGSFSEPFRAGGSTVKIATTRTLTGPLFFGYSFSSNPDYAYYEFSTEWGNPFAQYRTSLSPGDGCMVFNCAPGDAACYSTPQKKIVYGCPQPVNVTASLCT